jgi:hypothetical protein
MLLKNQLRTGGLIYTVPDYFTRKRSRLTLPGPANNKVAKHARNKPASSPLPKKSPWCATNNATDIVIINGIQASLVKRPSIINAAQKNSAKIASDNDALEPMPKGSAKTTCFLREMYQLIQSMIH